MVVSSTFVASVGSANMVVSLRIAIARDGVELLDRRGLVNDRRLRSWISRAAVWSS